jgi:hypothetical protein
MRPFTKPFALAVAAVSLAWLAPPAAADPLQGVGVQGSQLVLFDRYLLSGTAQALFVAQDDTPGGIHAGDLTSASALGGTVEIFSLSDPANRAVYDLSEESAPGGEGGVWQVSEGGARYVDPSAGPGGRGARLVVVKPEQELRVVAENLGDGDAATGDQGATDLDLGAIAPDDTLRVRVTLVNGPLPEDTHVMCTDFSDLTIRRIAGGGFRIVSRTSTAPADCGAPCACGAATRLTFTTGIGTGDCGAVTDAGGATLLGLACGGLYFGGGSAAVPLPATVPDRGTTVTNVAGCVGQDLTLAPATAADTGSNRTCSAAGCLFGPPLPIPNTAVAPLSTCLVNTVAEDASGTAQCQAGTTDLRLPLNTDVYLTGDIFPDTGCVGGPAAGGPCTADADCGDGGFCSTGIQTCPLCTADTTSSTGFRCRGGSAAGGACAPGSSDLGSAYPTSHDCPPAQPVLGSLPINFQLTTGTTTRSADPGAAPGVICGFCNDQDETGLFPNPPQSCVTDADCSQPFEACRQRSPGAFAAGAGRTVTETGSPAGDLTDLASHAQTLVSVFCIPPTFNGAIDASADLPGPGAVALVGSVQLGVEGAAGP